MSMIDVVIIGAGMSGIACARSLHAAGVPVRLIDKGRSVGGRVATRRAEVAGEWVTYDHGAQYLDQCEEAESIAKLASNAIGRWHIGDGIIRLVGAPEMASLPKTMSQGLNITVNTRVTAVTVRDALWEIQTDAGKTTASHLIFTVPAPQLAPILGKTNAVVQQAGKAVMRPCLTLMAAFEPDTFAPFFSRRDTSDVLSWIAQNNTKPGRSTAYQTWVAQAHPDWSAKHIDADREETKARMVRLLCDMLNVDPARLRHASLQGWRYGLVEKPLGQLFVSHGKLWAGGDWCCGPRVQDAWKSGASIAANVLQTLGHTVVAGPDVEN